jgi:dihydrofolate reductase
MISLIAAMDLNRCIGKDNRLLWHLPNDLKHFRQTTSGNIVVMGSKTFESIRKPLPNRTNIVLTRDINKYIHIQDVYPVSDVKHVLYLSQKHKKEFDQDTFIIGGEQIYNLFLPYAHKIYLTRIHHKYEGDVYFPELDDSWEIESIVQGVIDDKNKYKHEFIIYKKY